MNDFTASNGIIVGFIGSSQLWTVDPLASEGAYANLSDAQMQALREFFQAEADERLGRWRWPENPDFVVYPPSVDEAEAGAGLRILSESGGGSSDRYTREWLAGVIDPDGWAVARCARAYFDAHPEPKPWHEAKPGEVWEITIANQEPALYVVENTGIRFIHVERRLLALDTTDPEIVSGRRIWPEDAS